jgi:hypothetical protein
MSHDTTNESVAPPRQDTADPRASTTAHGGVLAPTASAAVDASSTVSSALSNSNPMLVDPDVNDDVEPLPDDELDALRDEIYSQRKSHMRDGSHVAHRRVIMLTRLCLVCRCV